MYRVTVEEFYAPTAEEKYPRVRFVYTQEIDGICLPSIIAVVNGLPAPPDPNRNNPSR